MSYYISRTVALPFEAVLAEVIQRLKAEGFGVLTDIDVQATLRDKIGAQIPRYRILGACNPQLAHEGLQLEDKLGVLLPCNVIIREAADQQVEVASIDPVASMERTGNPGLMEPALEIRRRLTAVVDGVGS